MKIIAGWFKQGRGAAEPAVRKEQVIRKAQDVIQRSLATTQDAAARLDALEPRYRHFTPLKRALRQRYTFPHIIGKSEPMLKIFDLIVAISQNNMALDVPAVAVQQVLRGALGGVNRGPGVLVGHHQVQHLGVRVGLHAAVGDVAVQRRVRTEEQLLPRLPSGIKGARNLRAAEGTIGEEAGCSA